MAITINVESSLVFIDVQSREIRVAANWGINFMRHFYSSVLLAATILTIAACSQPKDDSSNTSRTTVEPVAEVSAQSIHEKFLVLESPVSKCQV